MSASRTPRPAMRAPLRRELAACASGGALAAIVGGIVAFAGAWPVIAAHMGGL